MGIFLIVLGGIIELGLVGYSLYELYIGAERLAVLIGVVTLIYSVFYILMVTLLLNIGSSGSSRGGDFDCDMGDADCGDGGGGFSGGD